MFFVYILQSINNPEHFYVGYTDNLKRRIQTHNAGGSIHTNKLKPWKMRGYVAFDSEEKARKFEEFLKTGNGRIFQKSIFESPYLYFIFVIAYRGTPLFPL